MTLKQYLARKGIKEEAFAAEIQVKQPALNRYKNGLRAPRPAIARRIVAASGGEVTLDDIYGISAVAS